MALAGACFGLLRSHRSHGRSHLSEAIAFGALGLFVGLFWETRGVSAGVARAALNEINRVRDEHWLEMNPIDYA